MDDLVCIQVLKTMLSSQRRQMFFFSGPASHPTSTCNSQSWSSMRSLAQVIEVVLSRV